MFKQGWKHYLKWRSTYKCTINHNLKIQVYKAILLIEKSTKIACVLGNDRVAKLKKHI